MTVTCQVYQLKGHWEAMIVLLEAVRATVRVVFPVISLLTVTCQACSGKSGRETEEACGLLSWSV